MKMTPLLLIEGSFLFPSSQCEEWLADLAMSVEVMAEY